MKTVIDWSKSPERATHVLVLNNSLDFYMIDKGELMLFNAVENKWFASCCIIEWLTTHSSVIKRPVSPVFTQEMADDGTLPSVGMECNFAIVGGLWQDVFVDYISETVIVVTDGKGAQAAFLIEDSRFNPVTPPIELIDGKAYQFMHEGCEVLGFHYRGDFHNSAQTFFARNCTNIQPLTLEVKS